VIVANGITAIAAGTYHTLFLTSDGSLWAIGDDEHGQLGDGNTTDNATTSAERIVVGGVAAIAAGDFHSLFLKNDGSLWAMGENSSGQLGDGTYNDTNQPEMIVSSNVIAIAAGGGHSLFLKNDGSLWAMGSDSFGQLGDGTTDNGNYQTNRPEMIVAGDVTAIAAGEAHSLFIKSDGSLWAMGDDQYGQLGDGVYRSGYGVNQPEQIVAGSSLPAGYNHLSAQLLTGGNVRLSFIGLAGTNYALDVTFQLSPINWLPLMTNTANSDGIVVFTNAPASATNNFWRIRSVP
jgi:alpha-tubulin suppressor-like RCC1 family protein